MSLFISFSQSSSPLQDKYQKIQQMLSRPNCRSYSLSPPRIRTRPVFSPTNQSQSQSFQSDLPPPFLEIEDGAADDDFVNVSFTRHSDFNQESFYLSSSVATDQTSPAKEEKQIVILVRQLNDLEEKLIHFHSLLTEPIDDLSSLEEIVMMQEHHASLLESKMECSKDLDDCEMGLNELSSKISMFEQNILQKKSYLSKLHKQIHKKQSNIECTKEHMLQKDAFKKFQSQHEHRLHEIQKQINAYEEQTRKYIKYFDTVSNKTKEQTNKIKLICEAQTYKELINAQKALLEKYQSIRKKIAEKTAASTFITNPSMQASGGNE